MNDFKLIELVKEHPVLYDRTHKDFKNRLIRDNNWTKIAQILGSTGSECEKRFKGLRDRFTLKKRSGTASDPNVPDIIKNMMFLWDFVNHRPGASNLTKTSDRKRPGSGFKLDKEFNSQNIFKPSVATPTTSLATEEDDKRVKNSKKRTFEEVFIKSLDDANKQLPELQNSNDENDDFGGAVAKILKKMPEQQASLCRIEILKYLHNELYTQKNKITLFSNKS